MQSLVPAFAQFVLRAHPRLNQQRPTVGSVASWILLSTTCVIAALLFPQISEGAPGAIPAAFNVGNQGDAQYTIPIVAPAAAGGLKPNLMLTYDHRAGNGLAGMRWTLGGISAITRCQQTFAQDGTVKAVSYGSTDRFCLDGQRLVEYSGAYGASGTQYRTEVESFQRIYQSGTIGGGPLQFYVQHGNGLTSYYGYTADSRIEKVGSSAVRIWYLSYTEDQFGNRITYSYDENSSTGEAVPTGVTWSSNSGPGLTARYAIQITYETRPADDQRSGYDSGGALWANPRRIKKIEVLYSGTTIRTYTLAYTTPSATGTQRSQLARVSECRGTECVPDTVFSVQNGTRGWGSLTSTSQSAGSGAKTGDVNGDGKQDLYACFNSNWYVYYGNSAGGLNAGVNTLIPCGPAPSEAMVINMGGSGTSNLLYKPASGNWRWIEWHATDGSFGSLDTFVPGSTSSGVILDFDGDGLGDWVYQDGNAIKWMRHIPYQYPPGWFQAPQTLASNVGVFPLNPNQDRVPDFNGDGRYDAITRSDYCQDVPGIGTVCTPVWNVLVANGSGYSVQASLMGDLYDDISYARGIDVNGDGLDDLIYARGGGWYVALSTGTGFSSAVWTGISWTGQKILIADYDNDGREDLLVADGDYWRVYRSTGATFATTYDSVYSPGSSTSAGLLADVSGDGFPEIIRAYNGTWYTQKHQSALPDVVTTFTDGLGYAIGVTYQSLGDTTGYTFDTNEPPPYIALAHSGYVVTTENHDNGVGGTRQFTHQYTTGYSDVSGRGWAAFDSHRTNDLSRGTYTRVYFDRTFPYAGLPTKQELRRASDDQLIRQVMNALDKTTWTTTMPNRHFVRVESTTVDEYEVGGVANAQHLRTIVDDPTYDTTYGHVTARATTITDPVTSDTWTSTTAFNPTADDDDWCLGLPGLVVTTNTAPGQPATARALRHTFDPNNCRLTETRDESDTNQSKQLKTTYTYDVYGNVDVITTGSVDGAAQARSTDFDFYSDGQCPYTMKSANLTTTFECDYFSGRRASVTTPDSLKTHWTYDLLDRLSSKSQLDTGGGTIHSTIVTYYDCGTGQTCFPQTARFYGHAVESDGRVSNEYFDKLQRPVGSSWQLPASKEGREETSYDAIGRVGWRSMPRLSDGSSFGTSLSYDLINRLIQEDSPISEAQTSGATTGYDYRGPEVWITDPLNRTTKYVRNAAGQIKQVIDAANGSTDYTYTAFGELTRVRDPQVHTTTIGYDARGYKLSLSTPDMGNWNYDTSVYGELLSQTNALGQTMTLDYDTAGRIWHRIEPEGTTTFSYYGAGVGSIGKPFTISGPGHSELYQYDTLYGTPTLLRRTLDGTPYDFNMSYDAEGRLDVLTYPESSPGFRFAAKYFYNFSQPTQIRDASTSQVLYETWDVDSLGRETSTHRNSGVDTWRGFDKANGRLVYQNTYKGATNLQELAISYDAAGTVTQKRDLKRGLLEYYQYDALNRLQWDQVNGQAGVYHSYSSDSNVGYRDDVGGYYYTDTAHPHAVTSAGGCTYQYDANGRMTNRCGSTLDWTSYDLPSVIRKGTQSASFSYGVDRQRYKQVDAGSTSETIYYVGSLFEKHVAGASTTYRHYLPFRGEAPIVVDRLPNATTTMSFLHQDHQGSVSEVTSSSGALVDSYAFDPWGLRRNATTWAPLAAPFGGVQLTEDGYTGHEHLDPVGLIHMNGRVQDPKLGVFISSDPFVQAPFSPQSLNRYSYVWNNPASLIDPSGYQSGIPSSGFITSFPAQCLTGENGTPSPVCPVAAALLFAGGLADYGYFHAADPAIASVGGDAIRFGSRAAEQATHFPRPEPIDRYLVCDGGLMRPCFREDPIYNPNLEALFLVPLRPFRLIGGAAELAAARGATRLGSLTQGEARQIQAIAERYGTEINVVGSRAAGTAGPLSDFDYVIGGSARVRSSARYYLPRGSAGGEIGPGGVETGIDIFNANRTPLDPTRPFIRFTPGQPPVVGPQ